ncbi:MAG: sensor domain-containing diguanylate cyclase [Lachnospiraceae bacterium]|nr:sensor domain-containing diguanylate cyclase [Lachnospiraceae bacterium]
MERIKTFWKEKADLKTRMYYVIMVVGAAAILISLIITIIQGYGAPAIIATAVCLVFALTLLALSIWLHIERIGRYIMAYFVNIVFMPLIFFACGGVESGMPVYYLLTLFIIGVLLEGKGRIIAYIICLIVLDTTIALNYFLPELVVDMEFGKFVEDVFVTLIIASATVIVIISMIVYAYDKERKRSEELMERLRELSIKDELSGLYNRRELFRRLDSIYLNESGNSIPISKKNCYVAMLDIDDFKKLNDTYGHIFGDLVLATVSAIMQGKTDEDKGELAARYGGEEFVCVLRAADQEDAYRRVDAIREEIAAYAWKEVPGLTVTISGGVTSCDGYEDANLVMHDADSLLYKAKADGKNKIKRA